MDDICVVERVIFARSVRQDERDLLIKSPRNPKWDSFRDKYVALYPCCAACGTSKCIDVHHIRPFHLYPELELDVHNLVSLCSRHHLLFGHLENWSAWNPDVVNDAVVWRGRLSNRLMTKL